MSGRVVFVGDEIVAAGFRLAGIAVQVPERGGETAAVRAALGGALLVLLGSATAARIAQSELQRALASVRPLVLVLPDPRQPPQATDIGARVRLQLGLTQP